MKQSERVAQAFSKQSSIFDSIEEHHPILSWMRQEIRKTALEFLEQPTRILELNCGTGLDAIYFARQGHSVLATDISEGMINQLQKKVHQEKLENYIKFKQLNYEQLNLDQSEQFGFVFSNFGGLNCSDQIPKVIENFKLHLNPGAYVTFVIMPKVCPWELIYTFKFSFKFAFRRFMKESSGNVEGISFSCYYHSPKYIRESFGADFKLIDFKGLASLSFPPFMLSYALKFPRLYKYLCKIESQFAQFFPFNRFCDHYIITVQYQP